MNRREILEQLPYIIIKATGWSGEIVDVIVDGDYDGEYFSTLKLRVTANGFVQVINTKRVEVDKNGVTIPFSYASDVADFVYLHELILPNRPGFWKHYIDGDKLNNRSCNIEYKTPKEMMTYRRPPSTYNRAKRTHCRNGHELTEDNIYIVPSTGTKLCYSCEKARQSRYYYNKKKREKAIA